MTREWTPLPPARAARRYPDWENTASAGHGASDCGRDHLNLARAARPGPGLGDSNGEVTVTHSPRDHRTRDSELESRHAAVAQAFLAGRVLA